MLRSGVVVAALQVAFEEAVVGDLSFPSDMVSATGADGSDSFVVLLLLTGLLSEVGVTIVALVSSTGLAAAVGGVTGGG